MLKQAKAYTQAVIGVSVHAPAQLVPQGLDNMDLSEKLYDRQNKPKDKSVTLLVAEDARIWTIVGYLTYLREKKVADDAKTTAAAAKKTKKTGLAAIRSAKTLRRKAEVAERQVRQEEDLKRWEAEVAIR